MTVRALQTFFHGGNQVEHGGTERADDDPMVLAFPAFYEPLDEDPPAPRRGRPPGSKNKPKVDADG